MKKIISLLVMSLFCISLANAIEFIGEDIDCTKTSMIRTNLPFKDSDVFLSKKMYYEVETLEEMTYLAKHFYFKTTSVCNSNSVVYDIQNKNTWLWHIPGTMNWFVLKNCGVSTAKRGSSEKHSTVEDVRNAVEDGTYSPDLDMDNNNQIDPRDIIEKRKRDAGIA